MKFLRSIFGMNATETDKPVAGTEAGPDPVMAALAELEVKRLREALVNAAGDLLGLRDARQVP